MSIQQIRKSRRIQKTLQAKKQETSEDEEMASLALMLFSIVVTFLFCSIFQILADLLGYLFYAEDNFFYLVVLSPRHFLDVLNSCVNMIFYCMFGKRFRAELSRLMFRSKETQEIYWHIGNNTSEFFLHNFVEDA